MLHNVRFFILRLFLFLVYLVFSGNQVMISQVINPQKLPFVKICAQSDFNTFDANFKFSGFPALTTFAVQLSDETGSFVSPIATTTIKTVDFSASEKIISFSIPTSLKGSETYKLRVISSTGVTSGDFNSFDLKSSFPVYFKPYSQSFFINDQKSNVSICSGGSVNLTIDNPTSGIPSSSPANYPNLLYKWFKNNVLISGQTSSTLSVNANGVYYVEIDYGSCSDVNFRSQDVIVSTSSGSAVTISSSLSNPFCSSTGPTTLTATSGNSYVWRKDNVIISGAINQTYQTTLEGIYSVDVDFGGCKSTGSINLQKYTTTNSINVPAIIFLGEGETQSIIVTTNAVNPIYNWYLNGFVINGATSNSYVVNTKGDYKVAITQSTGCSITDEISFTINTISDSNALKIPNLISPNGDGINDVWTLPLEYISGSDTEVILMNSYGDIVLQTRNYINNWPESEINFKSINPVYYYIITTQAGKVKKGSITLVK